MNGKWIFALALSLVFIPFSGRAASSAERADARKTLLDESFYDEFYGADAVELLEFGADGRALALDFASQPDSPRASLDEPFDVDCAQFSSYELIVEVDAPEAIGYVSLYFHSKGGWYNATGRVKRGGSNRMALLFDGNSFSTEGQPGGLDEVDAIRISFWRGESTDAKLVFRSFKGARRSFALIDVDDDGGENRSFANSTATLFAQCGLPCERVPASKATAETLARYAAVVLPIAGKIKPETTDALCDYVDGGGFVFAFYNAPTKLLAKLGVKLEGYVKCSDAGLDVADMAFESDVVAAAQARGFELPEAIAQKSWNFEIATVDPKFRAAKTSPLFGDDRAHLVAKWREGDGATTKYAALIASASGLYCSHVFLSDRQPSRKALLQAFATSAHPQIAQSTLRDDWLSIFSVGLAPGAKIAESRVETLDFLERELASRGQSLEEAVEFLTERGSVDFARLRAFKVAVAAAREKRVSEFLSSLPSRPFEGRLWWEHSGCGIYRGDWDRTMKELSESGFNAVVPNLLWGGLAYYKSDVLPVARFVDELGDQVEQAVAAGKKYGVEVHAWMVCFNASNSTKEFLDQMSKEGRLQIDRNGEEKPWLCPSNPENQALELAALEEVATKYDVDGVHFDYIRYPDDSTCFCEGCKSRFAKAYREKTGRDVGDFPNSLRTDKALDEAWHDWRCKQITTFVRAVNASLRAKRPEIQISAAVFPGYPGTKRSIGQDWGLWIQEGLLDFVCPMDYTSDPAYFVQLVEKQMQVVDGKIPIYPGIGMTATGISMKPEEVALQASLARKLGANGFTIFNLMKSTADAALPAFHMGATAEKTPRKE